MQKPGALGKIINQIQWKREKNEDSRTFEQEMLWRVQQLLEVSQHPLRP